MSLFLSIIAILFSLGSLIYSIKKYRLKNTFNLDGKYYPKTRKYVHKKLKK